MRYPQNWCALVNVFYQRRCKDTVFVWYCVCVWLLVIRLKCVVELQDDELQLYCSSVDHLSLSNTAPEQLVTVW